jgi:Protein of unknown function (DUF3293)
MAGHLPERKTSCKIGVCMTPIPELLEAYKLTVYTIAGSEGSLTLHVGQHSEWLARELGNHNASCAAFVTAYNPGSELQPDTSNRLRNAEMLRMVQDRPFLVVDAIAPDGRWPVEKGYLVFGLEKERALHIGRAFGQVAILWAGADAVPEVVLC